MAQTLAYGRAGSAYANIYRHSGAVTFTGPLLALVVGLPAAIVMGFVYAYADIYVPIIYVNILLSLGLGAGVGGLCGWILRAGKVRNVPVALTLIFLLTAVAWYFSWAFWLCAVIDQAGPRSFSTLDLLINPVGMIRLAAVINEYGTWGLGHSSGSSVSGFALSIVWVAEAAIIFFGAFKIGRKFAGDLPFCETCGRWTTSGRVMERFIMGDPDRLNADLPAMKFDYLASLRNDERRGIWMTLEHHTCTRCQQFNVVRLNVVTLKRDRKGNERMEKKPVVPPLILDGAQFQALQAALRPAADDAVEAAVISDDGVELDDAGESDPDETVAGDEADDEARPEHNDLGMGITDRPAPAR